jgi:hypothetical protein
MKPTFGNAELVQALLLEVDAFSERWTQRTNERDSDGPYIAAIEDLGRLVDAVDVAVGGIAHLEGHELQALPAWLIDDPSQGLRQFLESADENGPNCEIGLYWDSARQRIRYLTELLGAYRSWEGRPLTAGMGYDITPMNGPRNVVVPVTKGTGGPAVLLTLIPTNSFRRLQLAQLPDAVATFKKDDPWQVDFENAIGDAHEAVCRLVGAKVPQPSYALSGVLFPPGARDRSVGLPVALNLLHRHLPRLLPPPVATGALEQSDGIWRLAEMPPDIALRKSLAAGLQNGVTPDEDNSTLLARVASDVVGVQTIRGCSHGAPPTLHDAAASAWPETWPAWFADERRRRLQELHFSLLEDRPTPMMSGDGPLVAASPTQLKLTAFFERHIEDQQASRRFEGLVHVLGDGPSTGRTWIAMGVADDLRKAGWHVLTLSRSGPDSALPSLDEVSDAAEFCLPAACPRRLIVIDDIRNRRFEPDAEQIGNLIAGAAETGLNLLLIVDSDGRQADIEGAAQEWNTATAPITAYALSVHEQAEVLDRLNLQIAAEPLPTDLRQQIEDLGDSLPGRCHRVVGYWRERGFDVTSPALTGELSGVQKQDCVTLAAICSLHLPVHADFFATLRPPPRHLIQKDARGVSMPQANEVLRQLSNNPDAVRINGLERYFNWLLDERRLDILALFVRRLQAAELTTVLEKLFPQGPSVVPRIPEGRVHEAIALAEDYRPLSRLVPAFANQVDPALSELFATRLAHLVRDSEGTEEQPLALAAALHVLWQHRSRLPRERRLAYLDDVRNSISSERLDACLANAKNIAERYALIKAVTMIFQGQGNQILGRLIKTEGLFATSSPAERAELVAALRLAKHLRTTAREASGERDLPTEIAQGGLFDLADQVAGPTWSVDAEFALLALKHHRKLAQIDPEDLAGTLVQQSRQWSVPEFTRAISALSEAARYLPRTVTGRAFRMGLAVTLTGKLYSANPAITAEACESVRRYCPSGLRQMLYNDGRPNAELARRLAEMIARYPDAKSVSRLLLVLVRADEDFLQPAESFASLVMEKVGKDVFIRMIYDQRLSVISHMVEALVRGHASFLESLLDGLIDRIHKAVRNAGRKRPWAPRFANLLLDAQDSGDIRRDILGEFAKEAKGATLLNGMRDAPFDELLTVYARLAHRLADERTRAGGDNPLVQYANMYGRGTDCQFCHLQEPDAADIVLRTGVSVRRALRRGGRRDADAITASTMSEHWRRHGNRGKELRLPRHPGRTAEALELGARHAPKLVRLVPDAHVLACIRQSEHTLAARILVAADRSSPGRGIILINALRSERNWEPILDEVLDEENPRRKAVSFRQLNRFEGAIDAERRADILNAFRSALDGRLGVPVLTEVLLALVSWDRWHDRRRAAAIDWGTVARAIGWMASSDLSFVATLLGVVDGLALEGPAERLVESLMANSIPARTPFEDLPRLVRRIADLDRFRAHDSRAYGAGSEAAVRTVEEIGRRYVPDDEAHLEAIGSAAYECRRLGIAVPAKDPLPGLRGVVPPIAALWSMAWLDAGWSSTKMSAAFGAVVDMANASAGETVGSGSAARALAVAVARDLVAEVPQGGIRRLAAAAAVASPRELRFLLQELADRPNPVIIATLGEDRPVIRARLARAEGTNPDARAITRLLDSGPLPL